MLYKPSDDLSDHTDSNRLTDKGRVMVDYISDLFESGMSIQDISTHMGIKPWCIQHLFILESEE